MSAPGLRRRVTVKSAKASAAPSASRSPSGAPLASPSPTITPTPSMATAMATQVALRTPSRRKIQPRKAARKGAADSRKRVLATVVRVMDVTKQTKAKDRKKPASTGVQPAADRVWGRRRPSRKARTRARKTTSVSER